MAKMKNSQKTIEVKARKSSDNLSPKEWKKITKKLIGLTVKHEELKTKAVSKC